MTNPNLDYLKGTHPYTNGNKNAFTAGFSLALLGDSKDGEMRRRLTLRETGFTR